MKVRLFILTILMLATLHGFCITPASDTMQLQNDTILRKEYVEKLTRREQQLCDSIRRINEEIRQKEIEDGVYERIRSHHDNRLGIWITIVVALFGVVAPLIINRQQNKKTDEALKKAQKASKEAQNANSANEKLKKSIQDIADEAQRSKEEALKAVDETKALVFVVQALKEDDVDKQIVLCNRAIAFDNNLVDAYILRGLAHTRKGEHDLVIEDYGKVIQIKPDCIEAYIIRGAAYAGKGEHDLAIEDYGKAIQIKPDSKPNIEAYILRGVAYAEKGEHDFAIEDYSKAIEIKPDNARPYILRGEAYMNKGVTNLAIKDYAKAIEINPYDTELYERFIYAHFDMAMDEDTAGNKEQAIYYYSNAIRYCEKILKLIPEKDDNRSSVLEWKKKCEEAIKRLRGD